MKVLWVRAKNYVGIFQGTGLKEIYIDFRKAKNRIIMINGRNGGGKSTLLDLINPYPDSNECFIKGEPAEKEIAYLHNRIIYVLNFDHPIVNVSKERTTTRAYIKKQTENGFTECNPTGNVTTFKDVLDTEFKLDPNFISLSKMSTEDKGLVDKRPSDRKKFINNIIESVEVYNAINKTLSKRASVYKSLMNNIVAKIDSIGDEEKLNLTLNSLENRLIGLKQRRDMILKNISEAEAMIKVLDPDLSIQTLYTSIQVELESIDNQLRQYANNIEYLTANGLGNLINLNQCTQLYADNIATINSYNNLVSQLQNSISEMLISREEENRSIQLKVQRLDSLKSEFNFADIEKSIKMYQDDIKKYEEFFENIHVKNAISISKDEYVSGLHTLKDIKDTVDGFKSFADWQTILDSIDYIRSNTNLADLQSRISSELDGELDEFAKLTNQHSYFSGLLAKLDILDNRPKACKIDSCAFIKDSLDAQSQKPKETLARLDIEIKQCQARINELEKKNSKIIDCLSCIANINIILRNIKNNANIINKLPNGHIFSDQDEFLDRVYKGDNFEDIDELYKYIGYANIFEEYKVAKETLYKLKTDYKIYESKNEVIEELAKDIEDINNKLMNISGKLDDTYSSIAGHKKTVVDLTTVQERLDTLISIFKKKEDLDYKKSDNESKLNAISANMNKIKIYIDNIAMGNEELIRLDNEIVPIETDREKIRYGLSMLKDYQRELNEFTESYNIVDVLRTYSSPTKKGIQNLFIKVYMSNTLGLANDLLAYLFDGRMKLLPYNIGDGGEFSIPCISMHTGMITDDISSCSRSEKSMISMILGFVLLRQSSTVYNILKLDEIDEGLDTTNRLMFISTLNRLLDLLEVEQCIMVSHSSELTGEVDVIELEPTANSMIMENANVIFSIAA